MINFSGNINIFRTIANKLRKKPENTREIEIQPVSIPIDTFNLQKEESLDDILRYNLEIREMINPKTGRCVFAKNNIPYKRDSYYAIINKEDVMRFEQTSELDLSGNHLRFDKGGLKAGIGGFKIADYVLEVTEDFFNEADDSKSSNVLNRKNGNFRIWKKDYCENSYKQIYTNIQDALSRNRDFKIY